MSDVIVTKGEEAGEELTAPLIDAAGDAREALAHTEHHAEKLAEHDDAIAEVEAKAEAALSVAGSAIGADHIDSQAREYAGDAHRRLDELEARLAEKAEPMVETVEKPDVAPRSPEPERKPFNILGFFHRIK